MATNAYELNTHGIPKIHLTLTGVEAGRPLCDCNKQSELAAGAAFFHATYAPRQAFTDPRTCPACLAAWDQAGKDIDAEQQDNRP